MKTRTRVKGRVEYNDGDFAEVETFGTEGIDEGLLLDTIQLHREDTDDTCEEFQKRLPVGMWLDISTTIEVSPQGSGR